MRIVRRSQGAVALCKTTAEVKAAIGRGTLAVVLHLEGAEAIDARSAFSGGAVRGGPALAGPGVEPEQHLWSWCPVRVSRHARCRRRPDGSGRKAGRRLQRAKILVDLSHITEKGFWHVARLSKAPLVATHSNAHALCPSPRNLTDRQLDAIRDTGGMVGLNFATCFLRPTAA